MGWVGRAPGHTSYSTIRPANRSPPRDDEGWFGNLCAKISGHTLLEMAVRERQEVVGACGACQDEAGGRRDPVLRAGVRSKADEMAPREADQQTNQTKTRLPFPSIPQPCHHPVGCLF